MLSSGCRALRPRRFEGRGAVRGIGL